MSLLRCALTCLVLAACVAADTEHHSIQKRQSLNDPINWVVKTFGDSPLGVAALAAIIVVIIVVGLLIDLVITLAIASAVTGRSLEEERSFGPSMGALFNHIHDRFDIVELGLKYMSVEEEACKYKAVCKAEQAAVRNPIASLAISSINSNLSGLSKYASAVEAGLNGEDCDLLYDQCRDRLAF